MNNLYKRIVTMGMISFSAILAWVYCVLAYREKTIYVVCLSLVLVISLYALLNSIINLHLSKHEDLKKYISDTVNATLYNLVPSPEQRAIEADRAREAERLAKATYVQIRKVNSNLNSLAEASSYNSLKSIDNYTALTLSLKEAVTKSITNTAKATIKYNKTDNQNVIDTIKELTSKMQEITEALELISTKIENINIVTQPHTESILEDSVMDEPVSVSSSFFDEFEIKGEEPKLVVEPAVESEPVVEPVIEPVNEDPNRQLTPDEIAALFSSAAPAANPKPVVEPEPVIEPVNENPNRQLTPDEIAALFNASKEERTAKSDEDFQRENIPEAMDQNLIDALLDNLDAQEVPAESTQGTEEDKIIPFPVNEDATPEATPIAEEFDPNKQLSPDEIAALFASINGGN